MLIIWNKNAFHFPQSIVFLQKWGEVGWDFFPQSNPPFSVKFRYFQCIWVLMVTLRFVSAFVSHRHLFFSFDSLSHLEKILKITKIRYWRVERENSLWKWNKSILHLYSFREQVRFGINWNNSHADHSCSTLYFQDILQTLIGLSEYYFCEWNEFSDFTTEEI
jgi:hypothetical protein